MKKNFVVLGMAVVMIAVVMGACIDGIPANPFLQLPKINDETVIPLAVIPEPEEVTYTIVIDMIDNEEGDSVIAAPETGEEGDTITLTFTIAALAHYNLLDFGGVTAPIDSVNDAGSGSRTYTVNADDAIDGTIIIIATFVHTNLIPDPITFTDPAPIITETYGEAFTNAITTDHLGSGAITYSSSDETVAEVDNAGEVTIYQVGSAVITASKEADAVYAHASASYTLHIVPRDITITAGTPNRTLIPFDSADMYGTTATFNVTVSGLIGSDTVTVGIAANTYGLSLSNNTNIGSAVRSVTITYNTTATVTQTTALSVGLTISNNNYTLSGATVRPTVIDGQTASRAIPVTSANITAFNSYANSPNGLTRHYKLMYNINISMGGSINWTAIGDNNNQFTGSFHGQGNTISNLLINISEGYQGMFGYIGSNGVVQNLGLVGGSVSGGSYVGGVVGYNEGTVQNCYATGSVSGNSRVGGVVGDNSGTVQNCYATASVRGSNYVGGVVGYNTDTVQNCYATGSVSGSSSNSDSGCGGVVGWNLGTVQYCYATGIINGTIESCGGVVGGAVSTGMRNCVALNPSVTIVNPYNYGRIGRVGGWTSSTTYANNYARSDMTLRYGNYNETPTPNLNRRDGASVSVTNSILDDLLGLPRYNVQSFWSSTVGWNLTSVWQWNSTTNLPTLRNMPGNPAQNHTVQ